jgi:hypothetical protein
VRGWPRIGCTNPRLDVIIETAILAAYAPETKGISDGIALARLWRYDAQSPRDLGLFVQPIVSLFLALGCSEGAGTDCHHSCPISSFAVDVPTDRVTTLLRSPRLAVRAGVCYGVCAGRLLFRRYR